MGRFNEIYSTYFPDDNVSFAIRSHSPKLVNLLGVGVFCTKKIKIKATIRGLKFVFCHFADKTIDKSVIGVGYGNKALRGNAAFNS